MIPCLRKLASFFTHMNVITNVKPTDINECASAPCQNEGSCIDGVNGYTCACTPGFAGLQCQTSESLCSPLL